MNRRAFFLSPIALLGAGAAAALPAPKPIGTLTLKVDTSEIAESIRDTLAEIQVIFDEARARQFGAAEMSMGDCVREVNRRSPL